MCVSENRENSDSGHDVGRLINTLSHQLKRQMCIQEGEDSLTTNSPATSIDQRPHPRWRSSPSA